MPLNHTATEPTTQAAVEFLHARGARFVVLRPQTKRPLMKGYMKNYRPAVGTVCDFLKQGSDLGIVPGSVNLVVFDIDHGRPADLASLNSPRVILDSRSRPRSHLFFDSRRSIGNGHFDLAGCSGDIRGDRGFVLVANHDEQLPLLSESLTRRGYFPPPILPVRAKGRAQATAPKPPPNCADRPFEPAAADLPSTWPGARWPVLFEVSRKIAYTERHRWSSLSQAEEQCIRIVRAANSRFPIPFGPQTDDGDDVLDMASKIAVWCMENMSDNAAADATVAPSFDHSPEAQKRRACLRHHGTGSQRAVEAVESTAELVVRLRKAKTTQGEISKITRLSRWRVRDILAERMP